MKKTLSIVLALMLVMSALAAVALIPDSADTTDPFKLVSIKVSDAAGYSSPFAAVDSAAAFTENMAAYVVMECDQMGEDGDKYTFNGNDHTIYITSTTLDLSYAEATDKVQVKEYDGTINAASSTLTADDFITSANSAKVIYNDVKNRVEVVYKPIALNHIDKVEKHFYAFIGVTKPATAGDVKACMLVAATSFATGSSAVFNGTGVSTPSSDLSYLVAYDASGTAKYTIVGLDHSVNATAQSFRVFSGKLKLDASAATIKNAYLFDYVQGYKTAGKFDYIGYAPDAADFATLGSAVGFTYDGKLIYLGADNTLGTADDVDLTSKVADCNTFFGFSFATNNPAKESSFEDKTVGNPICVSDTYAYVTATVPADDGVDVAPTGDFSANIVIVMAASAILAAAALAFVAKKARD